MTSPYKKRAKGSWSAGKRRKATSNAEERQFEKLEIEQALKETDPQFRVKRGKRKRNKRASLEYRLQWYQQQLEECEKNKKGYGSVYSGWMRDGIKRIKKELEELDE